MAGAATGGQHLADLNRRWARGPAARAGKVASQSHASSPTLLSRSDVVETALWPGTSLSAADPMRDHWAFRPKDATIAGNDGRESDDRPMTSMPASTIDADLEMVQRKIKALADEVNANELPRERMPMPTVCRRVSGSALEKSIGALKATAESMRERPGGTIRWPKRNRTSLSGCEPTPCQRPPLCRPSICCSQRPESECHSNICTRNRRRIAVSIGLAALGQIIRAKSSRYDGPCAGHGPAATAVASNSGIPAAAIELPLPA